MLEMGGSLLDASPLWTLVVLLTRFGGVFEALPGVGTEQFGPNFRYMAVMLISLSLTIAGVQAPPADGILEGMVVLGSEFALGFALGSIPTYILGGLSVAGQIIAGAIGLGQANMIDPSLGASVSVISRLKVMVATSAFLMADGHHIVIRLASALPGSLGLSFFRPDMDTAMILLEQLSKSFELAVSVSAPVLVTTLVVQFILGLITKFIPQVNIFIISLPLTLFVGLFLIVFSFPRVIDKAVTAFTEIEDVGARLVENSLPDGQQL